MTSWRLRLRPLQLQLQRRLLQRPFRLRQLQHRLQLRSLQPSLRRSPWCSQTRAKAMPIIRVTQPRNSGVPKPSYPLASTAARLARQGLSPAQVDAAHPARPALRGAGYARAPLFRSATAVPPPAARSAPIGVPGLFGLSHGGGPARHAPLRPLPHGGRSGGYSGGHAASSGGHR